MESWERIMRGHEANDVDKALEWMKDNIESNFVIPAQLGKQLREMRRPAYYKPQPVPGAMSYMEWLKSRGGKRV